MLCLVDLLVYADDEPLGTLADAQQSFYDINYFVVVGQRLSHGLRGPLRREVLFCQSLKMLFEIAKGVFYFQRRELLRLNESRGNVLISCQFNYVVQELNCVAHGSQMQQRLIV